MGYPRLQVAQPVGAPAPAAAQGPPGGAPPGMTSSHMPIDKVVEDVAAMGFSRDKVRAVVRKLTENGQSVDLNVVIDKLMNGANEAPQGWYGR